MSVFDTEADGLYPTKFHVLSYEDENGEIVSIRDQRDMARWLVGQTCLIGHNISRWDVPNLERVLNITISAVLIDTLALSWYLYPEKKIHGLEQWGEDLGIAKPHITDWQNQSLDDYIHRCEEDVKINSLLWIKQEKYLNELYDGNYQDLIDYLMQKMDCARQQEKDKWHLDRKLCESNLVKLQAIASVKEEELVKVMPRVKKYVEKTRPKKCFNKDGSWNIYGAKWFNLLRDNGLSEDYSDVIKVFHHEDEPNPKSSPQIKDWLFSLGWEPDVFKEDKEDDGSIRQIPQVKKLNDPELSDSVIALIDDCPEVAALEGYSVVNHRIGILEGFLRDANENNDLIAEIQGFTNTLRFKHTTIVNLPGVDKPYGQEIRECLVAREGKELCGTDMVAIEDCTKRHYIYPYDPEYVKEMSREGFDAHLDVALHAGFLTTQQVENHKNGAENHGRLRKQFKVVNYSAIYGVGAPKLSRGLRIKEKEAKALLNAYWKRNWAVKELVKYLEVKTINGQMWQLNPVSKLWYSLRYMKDQFSTLNQGTATYCFDCWVMEVRKKRPQLTAQFHDETVIEVKVGFREECRKLLQEGIDKVNEKLKLNVTLAIKPMFGGNYASIH
jgi:hypothetical protein